MKFKFLFFLVFSISLISAQDFKRFPLREYQVAVLSDSIQETSGLSILENRLFTINDSGNSADIFEIEKSSGKIIKKYETSFKNVDWEAIVVNDTYFFIGDFGNNLGSRKDLKIHKIPFLFKDEKRLMDSYKEISFFYPEQQNFDSKNLNHNFDAEAMVFFNGKLNVFTKEWVSKKITRYEVDPSISENQAAKKLEEYPIGFSVTDASFFEQKLYVVGYTKQLKVYLSIFELDENGMFFSKKPKSFILGSSLKVGQIEGIAVNEDGIFISGEKFKTPLGNVPPKLYHIPTNKIPR